MARWSTFVEEAPDLSTVARRHLDARRHKTLATLRQSGAPRISGIEVFVYGDDLCFGSMWRAQKALDLRRDPRVAVHSGSVDPPEWSGDVSISGRVVEERDPDALARVAAHLESESAEPWHLFRIDLTEVVVVELGSPADHLDISAWSPGTPVRRHRR